MLEAAAGARREVDDEEVTLVRQAAEEGRGRLDELRQVLHQPVRVLVAGPPDRERVRDALHAEVDRAVGAALEGRVHELVVVAARKTPPR